MAPPSPVETRAEELLGTPVVSAATVTGGQICTATRLWLRDGRSVLVKTHHRPQADFFASEARGLEWLREAGGVAVPRVLAVDVDCLILDWVETGQPTAAAAERLARKLAVTHAAGASRFGAPLDGFIGNIAMSNRPADTWAEFWVNRRVLPYLRTASDSGAVSASDVALVERAVSRIEELAGDPEPPSRIHGDLWSGNIVWSRDEDPHLVDPAAYGGHRESDLAVLALFGAPHLDRLLAAYHEAAPLAAGWRERQPLHQLYPLLVHALHFGGSYGARAGVAARTLLRGGAHSALGWRATRRRLP
jgi:fructosamine-3-kinase